MSMFCPGIYADADADNETDELYCSVSFGDSPSDDTVISGLKLYGADKLIESAAPGDETEGLAYVSKNETTDASMLRTSIGGKSCIAAVKHYCPKRAEGKRIADGYIYFCVPDFITPEDNKLIIEVDFFDSGSGVFFVRYVNGEGTTEKYTVPCRNTNKWVKYKIPIEDAYFNGEKKTILGDGTCDFRIERGTCENGLAMKHVALYSSYDKCSGRAYKTISVNGGITERGYFTHRMWSADSKNLLLYSQTDGYIYRYNIESDETVRLVKTDSSVFCMSKGDYLYYYIREQREFYRMNIYSRAEEKIGELYKNALSEVESLHTDGHDRKLAVQVKETGSDRDIAISESGGSTRRCRRLAILDISSGEWDLNNTHEFPDGTPQMTHIMMNPEYENLLFFCHEGTTALIPDRLWTLDSDSGEQKNVFAQNNDKCTRENVLTRETSGHEVWTDDGESIVFVKYASETNLGMNGIVRIDKYGEKREYINDDYRYWHCYPSADNRFIVADTELSGKYSGTNIDMRFGKTEIVLIDAVTSKSILLAMPNVGEKHPYQPHPCISPNGRLVSFSCVNGEERLEAAVMDISDITADCEKRDFAAKTNEDKGFKISEDESKNVKIEGTRDDSGIMTLQPNYSGGELVSAEMHQYILNDGEKISVGSSSDNLLLWNNRLSPLSFTPTAPQGLRAVINGEDNIALYWNPPENLTDDGVKYVIFRNGERLAETESKFYRDRTTENGSVCTYEISALYPNGTTSDKASVTVAAEPVHCTLSGENVTDNGLKFTVSCDKNTDSYTEAAFIGGRFCRRSTVQTGTDGKIRSGMFYFRTTGDNVQPCDKSVEVSITYFDSGNAPVYIEYNAVGETIKKMLLTNRKNTKQWKTQTIELNDAEFTKQDAISGNDFRISGGDDTYIEDVRLYNISRKNINAAPAEWSETENRNLSVTGRDDRNIYFTVSDSFIHGAAPRGITIEAEYFDSNNDVLYLDYSSNDKYYDGEANYKTVQFAKKNGTRQYKKAKIFLIDVFFTDSQTYGGDFRLRSENGVEVKNVKVTFECSVKPVSEAKKGYEITGGASFNADGKLVVEKTPWITYTSDNRQIGILRDADTLNPETRESSIASDGCWTLVEHMGRKCVFTGKYKRPDKICSGYIYFKLGEAFKPDNKEACITVSYYDSGGTGAFKLQYSTASGMREKEIPFEAEGWKTRKIILDDAQFNRAVSQANGYDFRLYSMGNDLYISNVSAASIKTR